MNSTMDWIHSSDGRNKLLHNLGTEPSSKWPVGRSM